MRTCETPQTVPRPQDQTGHPGIMRQKCYPWHCHPFKFHFNKLQLAYQDKTPAQQSEPNRDGFILHAEMLFLSSLNPYHRFPKRCERMSGKITLYFTF